jgi:nucleotide-binding universal stress UspA family protein
VSETDSANRPILVAVDFSVHSAEALRWAADAARRMGAPLEILHVVHDPASHPGYYRKVDNPGGAERIEDAAANKMKKFLKKVMARTPGLDLGDAKRTLVRGLPVTRILETAAASQAQLIVMGSQGRTGLPGLLLGSKSQRVVQLSPIPVTIVKAPQN